MDWYQIVILVIGILLAVIGLIKTKQAATILKETGELFTVVGQALEDGTLTKEEINLIISQAKDVKTAVVTLISIVKTRK
jgi:hypothetical protein